jgi:hypothetical protein
MHRGNEAGNGVFVGEFERARAELNSIESPNEESRKTGMDSTFAHFLGIGNAKGNERVKAEKSAVLLGNLKGSAATGGNGDRISSATK